MKISILCSDDNHPVYPYLKLWKKKYDTYHDVQLIQKSQFAEGGEILFMVSCTEIVSREIRSKYKANLVIHESDLPKGRGWSPLARQLIEGKELICISLIEAAEKVDAGAIWSQHFIKIEPHELVDEINRKLFPIKLDLMSFALDNFDTILGKPQEGEATYYRKRTSKDSQIDPEKSISSQFNLIRICDENRYPAFFELHGHTYKILLRKI